MQVITIFKLKLVTRTLIASYLSMINVQAYAISTNAEELHHYYQSVHASLNHSALGLPIKVQSKVQDDLLSADVSALLENNFDTVVAQLSQASSWCEFLPLNLNIKACTYTSDSNLSNLTLYAGRKHYQTSKQAESLEYQFDILESSDDYLHVQLTTPEGPMNTEDHRIELFALRVNQKSFLRIRTSYRESFTAKMATRVYLKTLGRDKVGFSVTDKDDAGNPVYVDGVKGMIERNAVRYAFAVRAFLGSLNKPPKQRFEVRIAKWYDLTDQYRQQLYEMDRATYLDIKRRERNNQIKLQDNQVSTVR